MAGTELFSTTVFSDANLRGYWRMEGNSNDAKGSNNGTDTSMSYATSDGKFNSGAHFSGTGFINFSDVASYHAAGNFTYHAWIKTSGNGSLFQVYKNGGTPQGVYLSMAAGKIGGAWGDGATFRNTSFGTAFNDGIFHMIDVIYDSGTQKFSLYIDSVFDSTDSTAQAITFAATSYVAMGHLSNAGGDDAGYFTGSIDDPAFLDRKLTQSEMTLLYSVPNSGGTFSLLGVG